jgi:hypothetical protein
VSANKVDEYFLVFVQSVEAGSVVFFCTNLELIQEEREYAGIVICVSPMTRINVSPASGESIKGGIALTERGRYVM